MITEIIDAAGDGSGNTLDIPTGIAVDGSGNVYVTGFVTDNAFKITPGGVITEIIDATGDGAGNTLDVPRGITVDGSGNVYVPGQTSDNAFKIAPDPPLLTEEFSYTAAQPLTSNGWTAYSGTGSNPILVTSGSLNYTDYPSSGIGNSTQVIGTGSSSEDVKRTFTSQTSGSVYASFLVNFSSATTAADGDYFFGFFTSTGTTMKGRVYVKKSGSNIAFGISKAGTTPTLTAFSYSLSTT